MRSNNTNNNQPVATQGLSEADLDGLVKDLEVCAERGENRGNQPSPSICKVSRILRDPSKSPFDPQLVSIGPIHRKVPKLKEFEWLKERYLNDLLNRREEDSTEILKACLLNVNTLIPQIRESYAGVKKNYSGVELARMMVMDGCFILEFCFKHEEKENFYLPNKMQIVRIAMDLMLLENQVPFFVLQALFNCSMGEVSYTLSSVLDNYLAPYTRLFRSGLLPEKNSILSNIKRFCSLLPEKIPTTDVESDLHKKISTTDVDHVLGYLHKHYQPVVAESSNPIPADAEASKPVDEEQAVKSSNSIPADAEASNPVDEEQAAKSSNPIPPDDEASKPVNEERIKNTTFHSIVELDRSGVNFKPHQEDEWSMTIKFQSSVFAWLPFFWKPTLLMPTLVIDDFTELILRNFIAYEQSFPQDRYYFTSYVHAMDMLIDTQEDVAILAESKVLFNQLCSNREAADMINKLGENMFVTYFYYTEEFKQMEKYYNGFWPKIKRTYFSNPWNVINLLAGIIVFIATVVGVIFAVLEYFR